MTDLARVWGAALVIGGLLTPLIACCWRARPHTAERWHGVATAIMIASLLALLLGAVIDPSVRVFWITSPGAAAWFTPALPERLPLVLVSVYLVVALALVIRLVAGLALLRRLARESTPAAACRLRNAASVAGVEGCGTHPRVASAVAFGWPNASVLLPVEAAGWPQTRIEAVLRHEAAHVARRDFLWSVVAQLYAIGFWPSPAAWWLRRLARRAAEFACDRTAARQVGERAYARALVVSAREFAGQGTGRLLAPGVDTDLYERLEALIATDGTRRAPSAIVTVVLVLLVSAVLMGATAVRVTAFGVTHHSQRHSLLIDHHHAGGH